MRRLGIVGVTFRRGGQAAVAKYTLPAEDRAERTRLLHEQCGFTESAYIATCNRVEFAFVCAPDVSVADYRERIYRFFEGPDNQSDDPEETRLAAARALHAFGGEGAMERLFYVAAALDSMVPGEAQVLGQVKEAFQLAEELGLLGPRLTVLLEEAVRAAKRVRAQTTLAERPVSMVSLALGVVRERLGDQGGTVALVGRGDMTRQAAEAFGSKPGVELLFVNRTLGPAEELAASYGGRACSLDAFRRAPEPVAVLLTSTAAREPVFDRDFFRRLPKPEGPSTVVVDLAVPRDVVPEATEEGVELHDIDGLERIAAQNRTAREAELASARVVVDEALDAMRKRLVDREMGPVVGVIRERFQHTVEEGLERLFRSGDLDLDDKQRERVTRWADTLMKRFAHIPTLGLKRLAFEHGAEAVESFLRGIQAEHVVESVLDKDDDGLRALTRTGEDIGV